MPLGFERLNERQQRPNPNINFIKPLEGPDKAIAHEFLSRIAAQCYPVMKKHYISVMALEEYEPNPEFLGRNFNAGEVIQLVLRDKQGRWLSMKFVQMVMMHELAHCKQMNHSRFFWGVRNEYAKQMEDLWQQGYEGEGMWGRGRGLANGSFVDAAPPDNTQIPEHLCGGSYRSKGRKRKRGQNGGQQEKLTYAERQQRRIARKFGKHGDGESLGDDELVRGALETMNGGKRGQGKPKVANSKRGRELRAAAALARFDNANKKEQTPELEEDMDSETESEWEAGDIDQDVVTIKDGRGRDLVKVCGEGEDNEEDAGKEMDELRMLSAAPKGKSKPSKPSRGPKQPARGEEGHQDSETESESDEPARPKGKSALGQKANHQRPPPDREDSETASEADDVPRVPPDKQADVELPAPQVDISRELDDGDGPSQPQETAPTPAPNPTPAPEVEEPPLTATAVCPICSLENDANALTCIVCSHVLRPKLMSNCWRCKSETCKGSKYINAGDAGRCGVCGTQKPKAAPALSDASSGRPMGITRPDVLRWD